MKLLRLKLNSDFRSLTAGFEVHFLREWDRGKRRLRCLLDGFVATSGSPVDFP